MTGEALTDTEADGMTSQLQRWEGPHGSLYFGIDRILVRPGVGVEHVQSQEWPLRYWTHYISNQTRRFIVRQTTGLDAFSEILKMQARGDINDGTVYVAYVLDQELTSATCEAVSAGLHAFLYSREEGNAVGHEDSCRRSFARQSFEASQYAPGPIRDGQGNATATVMLAATVYTNQYMYTPIGINKPSWCIFWKAWNSERDMPSSIHSVFLRKYANISVRFHRAIAEAIHRTHGSQVMITRPTHVMRNILTNHVPNATVGSLQDHECFAKWRNANRRTNDPETRRKLGILEEAMTAKGRVPSLDDLDDMWTVRLSTSEALRFSCPWVWGTHFDLGVKFTHELPNLIISISDLLPDTRSAAEISR